MIGYLLRRLLLAIPTLFIMLTAMTPFKVVPQRPQERPRRCRVIT